MLKLPPRRKRLAVAAVACVLLAASVFYISLTFQWREAFALIAKADSVWFFAGGSSAIIAYWIVRAVRWHLLMSGVEGRIPLLDLYLCSSVALSLSIFTPLQSGEALKVELLKRYAPLQRASGYSALLVERVSDLYVVIAIGVVALASSRPMYAAIATGLAIALPFAALAALHRVRSGGRLGEIMARLQGCLDTPAALALVLLSTFLSWTMVALGWYASLHSVGVQLACAELLGLLSVVTLASIASLIPGGLGVAEAGTAEMLLRYGVSAPLAQAGALSLRAFSLLVIALGAIHLVALRARPRAHGPQERPR